MFKKVATASVSLVFLASPLFVSALSADTQSQIDMLLTKIKQLQALIVQLQNGSNQSSCITLNNTLTLGSKDTPSGYDVSRLQKYLIQKGYLNADSATGYFGFLTAQAVGKLQMNLGLVSSESDPAYGFAGPKTRAAIGCGGGGSSSDPGPSWQSFSATPTVGAAPLTVKFHTGQLAGLYTIDFGDGSRGNIPPDNGATGTALSYTSHVYQSPGTYMVKLFTCCSTTTQVAGTATITVSGGSSNVVTEQVKCVFTGATTEQKCWGDAPSRTVGEPTHYGCTGVGTCVMTVSGPKGTPITWGSSCGGSDDTIIGGGNKYAYFSCSTIKVSANAGDNRTITLPTSSVTPINQSASSPETGVLTYKWTNVERTMGTAVPVITNGTTLAPTFSGLTTGGEYSTIGQYTFRLTVTDSHGQTATDDMVVTVNP